MEWIGRAVKDNLRSAHGGGEMGWVGINSNEQRRFGDQCCQCEQIEFAGQIEDWFA